MNRLPCCDRTTQRSELAVFASLGFAGVVMVALALVQMTRFVASADQVAAAVQMRQAAPTAAAARDSKIVVTNAVETRTAGPGMAPDKV
jgi:hypothetical protein